MKSIDEYIIDPSKSAPKSKIDSYIVPTDMDGVKAGGDIFTREKEPFQLPEEMAKNPISRAATSFVKQTMSAGDTARNASLLLNNIVNFGNEETRKRAEEDIRRKMPGSDQFQIRPAETFLEKTGDIAGNLLGGMLQGYAMGIGSGTTPIGGKILEKTGGSVLGKSAASAVDNALLGLPMSAMQSVSQNDNAGDMAKALLENVAFDLASGAGLSLLGSGINKLGTKGVKVADELPDAVQEADVRRSVMEQIDGMPLEQTQADLVNGVHEAIDRFGFTVEDPGAKSIDSIVNKTIRKQAADPSYSASSMKDHARTAVLMNSIEDVPRTVDALKKRFPHLSGEAHIETPLNNTGYRGVHLTVPMGNGLNAEIQLSTPEAWAIKKRTDAIYEKWRNVDIGSLSSNQIAAYRKDMERSQGLWNAYYSGMTPEVKRAASETVMGLESIQRPSVPVNGTQEPSINSNFGTSPTATSTVPFSDSEYSNIADTPLSDFSISQNAGRSKSSQATAASMDRDTFNRIYEATGKNIPTTVKVNGMDIPSSSFMDSVDSMLPDSIEDLTFISDQARELENADLLEDQLRAIGKINERMETQISPQMLGYGSEKSGPLKINIQLFASSVKRKLEWLELSSRPEGPHIGDFLKRHMQGIDDNSELGRILKENAVGTPARPDSVVADEAAELISTEAKRNSLYNKIMNLEEGQALSDKEVVAAKRMIREFTESGDYDKAVNLIRGADRSGTESGRALRQFGNTLATDPEGVLRRASRSMREGFDAAHFAGAADQVDDFISRFSRRVQKATEGRSITSDDILRALDDSISSASSKQIGKLIGKNKKALAERIYEAVNNGALDNDDLRHAFYNALNFPQLSSETARRLVELSKKAEGLADYSKEQAQVFEEIYQTIADEIPMSALEKWQSWRKFAMLSNPKTHLKNMASNAAMRGVRKVTDTLSAWLEKVFIRDPSKRTKSLFWKGSEHGKRILPQVNEAAERAVMEMGNVGKFDISDSAILKHRKMFKDKGLRKGVNFASSLNSKLLEGEDVLSFRPIFRDTLGQYMTARGLTDVTDEAYKYAFDASLEAVFRADNALNDAISSLKRSNHKITREIVDMVVPFSKTPSNLIVQAVEYSPVGLAKSGVDLVLSLSGKSGKEAAEIINEFSKGLVGTGLSVLGFYLGRSGLINTKYSQGKKQQAAADVDGELENSIDFFGTNVSIDWIQPAAFPLIFGAVIGQSSADGDTDVAGAILDGADSIFELSMLQSISELFNSESISEGLSTVPANAISQSIPTVMGQIARSVDPIQRRVKGDSFLETSFNTVTSKIPWATTLLEPRTDLWGNEVRRNNTENPALNAFNQLINPFSVKSATYQDDPVTQMLLQIYKDSKDSNALPSFPTDTVEHPLSLKEYTQYAQTVGDAQRDAVEELLREIQSKNPRYKFSKKTEQNGKEKTVTYKKHWDEMTADEKAKILDRVFSEAKTDAEDELDKFVKGAFQ